jgi:hypothetical protein
MERYLADLVASTPRYHAMTPLQVFRITSSRADEPTTSDDIRPETCDVQIWPWLVVFGNAVFLNTTISRDTTYSSNLTSLTPKGKSYDVRGYKAGNM